MTAPAPNFIHRYVPAERGDMTILLLHGTGGTEDDLLPLGRALAPGAGLLSPRGKVLENGMPRFFRRLAEGVFDAEEVKRRANDLADFVSAASVLYRFDPSRVVAAGYSNGANIAVATLLVRPQTLAGAVLFRAMVPFEPDGLPDLSGRRVHLSEGETDPIVPRRNAERLRDILAAAGAQVTLRWAPAGHELLAPEIDPAKEWLAASLSKRST